MVGARNVGYILVFDPVTTGLRDGFCAADDGVVWFTESAGNKLAKLESR